MNATLLLTEHRSIANAARGVVILKCYHFSLTVGERKARVASLYLEQQSMASSRRRISSRGTMSEISLHTVVFVCVRYDGARLAVSNQ
jgi:diphthamide biosynthesis methyltransferase